MNLDAEIQARSKELSAIYWGLKRSSASEALATYKIAAASARRAELLAEIETLYAAKLHTKALEEEALDVGDIRARVLAEQGIKAGDTVYIDRRGRAHKDPPINGVWAGQDPGLLEVERIATEHGWEYQP